MYLELPVHNKRPDLNETHPTSGAPAVYYSNSAILDLNDNFTAAIGIGGGVIIDQRLLVGVQIMSSPSEAQLNFVQDNTEHHARFNFSEYGFWSQYSLTSKRTVQPFVGMQLGWGTAVWEVDGPEQNAHGGGSLQLPDITDKVFVINTAVGTHFNFSHWFRPDLVVGYRFVDGLTLEGTSPPDLNGFYFGMNLLFGGQGK